MKSRFLLLLFAVALMESTAFAQHAGDVEIGYVNGELVFEVGEETFEGFGLFEAEFEDIFGDIQADEPGFDTDPNNPITTGHQVFLNLRDASADSSVGVGHLNFFNPTTGMLEVAGDLSIFRENNSPVADLVIDDGLYTSGSLTQFIDQSDAGGEVHGHVIFDLLEDAAAPVGAYGMLFELESYHNGFDGTTAPDLVSDKFWIVLNNGMTEEDFETFAVPAFGVVPEPGSVAFILLGAAALGVVRRKK